MKTYKLENDYDANVSYELREYTYEDALCSSLRILGYNLVEIEGDNENPFPVDEQKLKDFLEYFENQEYHNTGMIMFSGGYVIAEYDGWEGMDDDDEDSDLLFRLCWGEENTDGKVEHVEYYRISVAEFNSCKTAVDIYRKLRD